ncbi:MAG: hypothetical protein AAGC68_10415 [Verrucomicrobiota bacterium]
MKATFRNYAHIALAIPTVVGIALVLIFLIQSADNGVGNRPFAVLVSESWNRILNAIPAEMPAVWSDAEASDFDSIDDLDDSIRDQWAWTNAYLVSCSFLVLLGVLGIGLSTSAVTVGESRFFPLLRVGGILMVTFCAWLLWAFNLAFPGEHVGILPRFWFGFPDSDPISYGFGGITAWSDCFYITAYAVFAGALIMSFGAARITALSLFLITIPFVSISFPLVLSWKWGAGWLENLGNNYDFAGSALVHWHVGAVALVAAGLLSLFRRGSGQSESVERKRSHLLTAVGGFLYFLGVVGMNTGSTLDSDPAPVAAVLQVTLIASFVSAGLALVWWACTRKRSPIEMFFVGLISGAVAVSGASDSLDFTWTVILAVLAGTFVPGLVIWLDQIRWPDPLAVGPVHGIAGIIGTLGAGLGIVDGDFFVSFFGQLLLLFVIPVGAILTTFVVLLFCGAIGFLFTDRPDGSAKSEARGEPSPPPLPPRAS